VRPPLTDNFMKSPRRRAREHEVFQTQVAIPGLYELVSEMGYLEDIQARGLTILNPRELFREGDMVVELQDIRQEQGHCYVAPCAFDQRLHFCRLFEDDRPLGPVVGSHQRLREEGGGSYSIWETADGITIYFSTSDNTDPRRNGRTYTLRSGSQTPPQESLKPKPISSTPLSPGTVMDKQVCAEPWQNMIINIDGNVSPCCFWANYQNSGIPLGNTNDQSLEEIWNGEGYRWLRWNIVHRNEPGFPCYECLAYKMGGNRYPPPLAKPSSGGRFPLRAQLSPEPPGI
jgi:radical SAM protein with 4Fe4S-binding SPASM domain